MSRYTFAATLQEPIAEVRPHVEAALKDEGFGVLTEIDVAATLKTKLDLDLAPYLILGACNPRLAHRALEIDPSIGAVLPCNVVLRESDGSGTILEILDPEAAFGIVGTPGIAPIATEAAERLRRVLQAVASGATGENKVEQSSAPTQPSLR